MYEVMSKKLLVINILDILNKYSDAEHRLKQKDFIDIPRKEYGMEVDRKAVRRNLSYLLECGYDKAEESSRKKKIFQRIIAIQNIIKARLDGNIKNEYTYSAKINLINGGNYGYTFRAMPKHEMMLDSANLNLVKWITD